MSQEKKENRFSTKYFFGKSSSYHFVINMLFKEYLICISGFRFISDCRLRRRSWWTSKSEKTTFSLRTDGVAQKDTWKVFCPLFPNYFLISKIAAIERQNRSSSYSVLVQFRGVGSLVDRDLVKRLSESGPNYEKKSWKFENFKRKDLSRS